MAEAVWGCSSVEVSDWRKLFFFSGGGYMTLKPSIEITELLGGRIEVLSQLGHGSGEFSSALLSIIYR